MDGTLTKANSPPIDTAMGVPGGSEVKSLPTNAGGAGSIAGLSAKIPLSRIN